MTREKIKHPLWYLFGFVEGIAVGCDTKDEAVSKIANEIEMLQCEEIAEQEDE